MYTPKRTNQSGSVAIFIIVSIILAAGVIGGIYVVQQRGDAVRSNTPIAKQDTSTKQSTDTSKNDEKSAADKQKQADEAKKQAEQKDAAAKQAEADKKAAADKQAAADAEKKRQQDEAAQKQAATIPQTSTAPAASNLPQTGPADTMPQVFAGAILLGVLLAYLKSYRHRFGSLLR